MFRLDIRDNALKTKVSNKYDRKKPRWMEQLNKSEAPRVAPVQYCEHDVEYGSPSKNMEMIYDKTEKKSDFCFVCFLVSLTPKPSISFTPTAFTDNSVHQIYQTSHGISWLQHSWPPKNNSRLADFLFDPSVFFGSVSVFDFFWRKQWPQKRTWQQHPYTKYHM